MTIHPIEVKRKKEAGEDFILLDVRERWEYDLAHIPDSVLIPLSELPRRIAEMDSLDEIVTVCHHGMRSASAQSFLIDAGFLDVKNMMGGIDAYSTTADPTIPRYR
ncbi:MAG: rhodanese-like domain-containing protein [Nitrospirota bacterium]